MIAGSALPAARDLELDALRRALIDVHRTVCRLQDRVALLSATRPPAELQVRRQALKLSQSALARATGVYGRGAICDAESGRRKAPLLLATIAQTLETLETGR